MAIFDAKEEVLQLELTPYGRELLGTGDFKPVYYTFHDDQVIYDVKYAGGTESDYRAPAERILSETFYLKPIPRITAINDYFKQKSEGLEAAEYNFNRSSIVDTSILAKQAPAYKITINGAEIATATENSPSGQYFDRDAIKQIWLKDIFLDHYKDEETGTYLIAPMYLDIVVEEQNTDFLKDNFEFQLFNIKADNENYAIEKHYKFNNLTTNVINDIYYDNIEPGAVISSSDEITVERLFDFYKDSINTSEPNIVNTRKDQPYYVNPNTPPYGDKC
jgi:hypothetical protein